MAGRIYESGLSDSPKNMAKGNNRNRKEVKKPKKAK